MDTIVSGITLLGPFDGETPLTILIGTVIAVFVFGSCTYFCYCALLWIDTWLHEKPVPSAQPPIDSKTPADRKWTGRLLPSPLRALKEQPRSPARRSPKRKRRPPLPPEPAKRPEIPRRARQAKPQKPASALDRGLTLEKDAERLFKAMRYRVQSTATTGDGGVDLVLLDEHPVSGGRYIVQCKNYKANIGQPAIRDFYGTVMHENAQKGIFVTTSRYTKAALEFAKGKPLKLIDGKNLDLLMWQYLPPEEQDDERIQRHENQATAFYDREKRLAG